MTAARMCEMLMANHAADLAPPAALVAH
jgi:hypothetical protein